MIILTICALLVWHWRVPLDAIGIFFIIMEIGAILGAMWAQRLVSKFERPRSRRGEDPKLPKLL